MLAIVLNVYYLFGGGGYYLNIILFLFVTLRVTYILRNLRKKIEPG